MGISHTLKEAVFTTVLVGAFASMALIPFPNATAANLSAIAFLQTLGAILGALRADAHLSPAITIMLTVAGKVAPAEAMHRVLGQIVGAPFLLLFVVWRVAGNTAVAKLGLAVPTGPAWWIVAVEGASTFALLALIFKSSRPIVPDVGGTVIGGVICPRLKFWVSMNPAGTAFAALCTGEARACALALAGSLSAAVAFGVLERRSTDKFKQA